MVDYINNLVAEKMKGIFPPVIDGKAFLDRFIFRVEQGAGSSNPVLYVLDTTTGYSKYFY